MQGFREGIGFALLRRDPHHDDETKPGFRAAGFSSWVPIPSTPVRQSSKTRKTENRAECVWNAATRAIIDWNDHGA